jgi:hypothetical protein
LQINKFHRGTAYKHENIILQVRPGRDSWSVLSWDATRSCFIGVGRYNSSYSEIIFGSLYRYSMGEWHYDEVKMLKSSNTQYEIISQTDVEYPFARDVLEKYHYLINSNTNSRIGPSLTGQNWKDLVFIREVTDITKDTLTITNTLDTEELKSFDRDPKKSVYVSRTENTLIGWAYSENADDKFDSWTFLGKITSTPGQAYAEGRIWKDKFQEKKNSVGVFIARRMSSEEVCFKF